jgi:hypothetical protein
VTDETIPASMQPAPIQQSPQDRASESAVEAYITNAPPEQIETKFSRASVEHRRSADDRSAPGNANDQAPPLGPMPEQVALPSTEVTAAVARLNEKSDGHSDLVARWGESMGENLAYAKAAWKDMQSTQSGRDLIAKASAAGLGDDPHIIEHLSSVGRQNAGRLGDFTISRNAASYSAPAFTSAPTNRAGPSGTRNMNGSLEARGELNALLESHPPGSPGYSTPSVSRRISDLYRMLAGTDSVVGRGGRTS